MAREHNPMAFWALRLRPETIQALNDVAKRDRCTAADIARPAIERAVARAVKRGETRKRTRP